MQREDVDSDHFSDSNSSFLANEKLMSVDSMSSDLTGKTNVHPPLLLFIQELTVGDGVLHHSVLWLLKHRVMKTRPSRLILVCDCDAHACIKHDSCLSDDDIDLVNLPEDELELYFNKLVPPAMQRGRVEGQEIPVRVRLQTLRRFVLYFILSRY